MSRRIQESVAMATLGSKLISGEPDNIAKILLRIKDDVWSNRAMYYAKYKLEVKRYFYDTLLEMSKLNESVRVDIIKYMANSNIEIEILNYLTTNFSDINDYINDVLTVK